MYGVFRYFGSAIYGAEFKCYRSLGEFTFPNFFSTKVRKEKCERRTNAGKMDWEEKNKRMTKTGEGEEEKTVAALDEGDIALLQVSHETPLLSKEWRGK